MTRKTSAGILMYRLRDDAVQVLIGHMGGPFWARKDDQGWSIPKGEYGEGEDAFSVALREFEEELGSPPPATEFLDLGVFKQPSGKEVVVWAAEGDLDSRACTSNTFEMEWPKGSGKVIEVPEIDKAEWFDVRVAREKLLKGHVPVLDELMQRLHASRPQLSEGETQDVRPDHLQVPQQSLF